MTGGQISPTSDPGLVTTTTPRGNHEEAFDLCKLAEAAGAVYVARWTTAHPRQVVKSVTKGIKKKGLAFIEILSQCPVHRKMTPTDMLAMFKENTVRIDLRNHSNRSKVPIGEFRDQERIDWFDSYDRAVMGERERGERPNE
jgi:2-oxoglutarate ferredoxin oxidoreductase subunit beta